MPLEPSDIAPGEIEATKDALTKLAQIEVFFKVKAVYVGNHPEHGAKVLIESEAEDASPIATLYREKL
jgi:hypothetical protein